MEKLPPELLTQIMKLANHHEAKNDPFPFRSSRFELARFCRVNRFWRDVARPLLYFSPSTNNLERPIQLALLIRTLKDNPKLGELVRGFKASAHVRESSSREELQTKASTTVSSILRACPNLEYLKLSSGVFDLAELLSIAPKLRYLDCSEVEFTSVVEDTITSPLELLRINMGTDFHVDMPTITFPQLRHLSYNYRSTWCPGAFCQTLAHLRNLDINASGLTSGMKTLFATLSQLDHLSIKVRACLDITSESILEILFNTKILSLTLRHVSSTAEVIALLNGERRALRHLQSLRTVCSHISGSRTVSRDHHLKEEMKKDLQEACQSRGIVYLGNHSHPDVAFWEHAAPDF